MTEQITNDIKSQNELIATFMGFKQPVKGYFVNAVDHHRLILSYHWCWSELMPVWYKFVDLRFPKPVDQLQHSELKTIIGYAILYGGIELAFVNIIQGIQWYNSINK